MIDTAILHCSISANNSSAVIKLSQSKDHIELIKKILLKNIIVFSSIEPICFCWGMETETQTMNDYDDCF